MDQIISNIHDLAKAPLQTVLKQWQGLGYYNRAKNLHKAAYILINEHKGIIPKDPQSYPFLAWLWAVHHWFGFKYCL